MTSDIYFVLEQFSENQTIVDFREHPYAKIKPVNPEEVTGLPSLNARDYLRGLANVDSEILTCKSRRQLVNKLEALAKNADMSVDMGARIIDEFRLYSATRDNIRQLIKLLK